MPLLIDIFRSLSVYAHLLFFGVSIALVFWGDLRILRGEMKNDDYTFLGTLTLRLFLGLWLTGLTIIFVDTGFNLQLLMLKPKLLIKLGCISILSLNAIVLHRVCLNILRKSSSISLRQALILSCCGAISTSHWLIAAFVGSANMLEQFSLDTLSSVYFTTLAAVLLIGVGITPLMQRIPNQHRLQRALHSVDLHLGDLDLIVRDSR